MSKNQEEKKIEDDTQCLLLASCNSAYVCISTNTHTPFTNVHTHTQKLIIEDINNRYKEDV